jgi:predicted nucleic acid-binding protein
VWCWTPTSSESGLAYPGSIPGKIVGAWRQGALEVALSHYILDEMVRVLPRMSKIGLTAAEIRDRVDSFLFLADIVEPEPSKDAELRDAGDQAVSAAWKAARTQYLITGNNDLLALSARLPIVTPAAFWERHGG